MIRAKKKAASTAHKAYVTSSCNISKTAFTGSGFNVGQSLPGSGGLDVKQGGGLFYSPTLSTDFYELPRSVREEHMWYQWFYEHHPIIGRAIDMHTNLPLSKAVLSRPETEDAEKGKKIQNFFLRMWTRLRLDEHLINVTRNYNLFGEAFPYHEWDEEMGDWSRIFVLDGSGIEVSRGSLDYVNQVALIPSQDELKSLREGYYNKELDPAMADLVEKILASDGQVPLDTDPMSGTHVAHLMRQAGGDGTRGVSVLKRCLTTLLYQDKLRQAQTQISSRNMTPKHLIYAENLSEAQVEDLRAQVDMAFIEPDYAIIANYEVHWETKGADDRLLNIEGEYELTDMHLLTGLGLTREIVSGEGNWGSTRINIEVLNTEYLSYRTMLQRYVEESIFRPVAIANGFIEESEYGEPKVLYPKLTFSRLSIRDNEAVFGDLFSLYQKGSLPASVLFELYNLDPNDVLERLREEMFTILDPQFGEASRGALVAIGDSLGSEPDIRRKVAESLDIKPTPLFLMGDPSADSAGGFGGAGFGGGDFGSDAGGFGDGDFGPDGDFGAEGDFPGDGLGDIPEGDLGGDNFDDLGADFGEEAPDQTPAAEPPPGPETGG